MEKIYEIERKVAELEERFGNMNYDLRGVVQSEMKDHTNFIAQAETQFGLYTALCVGTLDPWKQNRVRFYCPLYHNPKKPIAAMPWAWPISPMGGFDDSGLSWVPPAGSTLAVVFESGHRDCPYYLGTLWQRNRGPEGSTNFGFNIDEYNQVSAGHRKGYLVGPNDESQVLPPWNTESSNGFDITSIVDFDLNPEAQRLMTYPNIYGFKTPEKHFLKMVDGDARCNRRWKRMELMSSCGNWMMFKDDHLHYAGQWAHPSCGARAGDVSCIQGVSESGQTDVAASQGLGGSQNIVDDTGNENDLGQGTASETTDCSGTNSSSNIIGGQPDTSFTQNQVGANPYFKSEQECRPYKGPGTPLNPVCSLPQSGIQIMSISGHNFVMDDSVYEPSGIPEWERSTKDFDYGCNNSYAGATYWQSSTGHKITMSDVETQGGTDTEQLRSNGNGIQLLTANGNQISLNDETIGGTGCSGCPPNIAGPNRGILMTSTSNHTIQMCDDGNEQCSPCRKGGGTPAAMAKNAFIQIKTGYGITIDMNDANSQTKTQQQFFQIKSPQTDNQDRGPHIFRMEEVPSGPGLVMLRTGGYYFISTNDDMVEIVGDPDKNPSDKVEYITNKKLMWTEDAYINYCRQFRVIAQDKIYLMAGEDCPEPNNQGKGPCVGPVLVFIDGEIVLSDRVYASASPQAQQAPVVAMAF